MEHGEYRNVNHLELYTQCTNNSKCIHNAAICYPRRKFSITVKKNIVKESFVFVYDDRTMGVLGVVGPKRMEYPRIMALVDYTANLVSQVLTKGP